MNYRDLYKKKTGVVIGREYEVHHIDHNRSNNNITNLVALPRDIHRKYHKFAHEYNQAIYMMRNAMYFYKSEKQKYLKSVNVFMDYKEIVYRYVLLRDKQINSHNER